MSILFLGIVAVVTVECARSHIPYSHGWIGLNLTDSGCNSVGVQFFVTSGALIPHRDSPNTFYRLTEISGAKFVFERFSSGLVGIPPLQVNKTFSFGTCIPNDPDLSSFLDCADTGLRGTFFSMSWAQYLPKAKDGALLVSLHATYSGNDLIGYAYYPNGYYQGSPFNYHFECYKGMVRKSFTVAPAGNDTVEFFLNQAFPSAEYVSTYYTDFSIWGSCKGYDVGFYCDTLDTITEVFTTPPANSLYLGPPHVSTTVLTGYIDSQYGSSKHCTPNFYGPECEYFCPNKICGDKQYDGVTYQGKYCAGNSTLIFDDIHGDITCTCEVTKEYTLTGPRCESYARTFCTECQSCETNYVQLGTYQSTVATFGVLFGVSLFVLVGSWVGFAVAVVLVIVRRKMTKTEIEMTAPRTNL